MIYGIGIDIVKVDRIRAAVEKWGRDFLERIFTDTEISYCYGKRDPYLSLSVRFAAKEALIKAAGHGAPVSFRDIEIVNREAGSPAIRVGGRLADFFIEREISLSHVSLSHEREYGIAAVVLEVKK